MTTTMAAATAGEGDDDGDRTPEAWLDGPARRQAEELETLGEEQARLAEDVAALRDVDGDGRPGDRLRRLEALWSAWGRPPRGPVARAAAPLERRHSAAPERRPRAAHKRRRSPAHERRPRAQRTSGALGPNSGRAPPKRAAGRRRNWRRASGA